MNLSRYEFESQKTLHKALQLAKGLGHEIFDVEHVAVAALRSGDLEVSELIRPAQILARLEQHIALISKKFGKLEIRFGARLNSALNFAEAEAGDEKITLNGLWKALVQESSLLKLIIQKQLSAEA